MKQHPESGGSYEQDKGGGNLKQAQYPTVDHPSGNRARQAEQTNELAVLYKLKKEK